MEWRLEWVVWVRWMLSFRRSVMLKLVLRVSLGKWWCLCLRWLFVGFMEIWKWWLVMLKIDLSWWFFKGVWLVL